VKKLGVLLIVLVLLTALGSVSANDVTNLANWKKSYESDADGDGSGSVSWDSTKNALKFAWSDGGGEHASYAFYICNVTFTTADLQFEVFATGGNGKYTGVSVGVIVITKEGIKYGLQYKSSNKYGGIPASFADQSFTISGLDAYNGWVNLTVDAVSDLQEQGVNISANDVASVQVFVSLSAFSSSVNLYVKNIHPETHTITFDFKDTLSGSSLTDVTVEENGQVLGTLDDGGRLELTKGQHTLTFEKSGYWSVTEMIDVEDDMTVSVEMYPSSAAFKLENFPADISIPENTIYTLTFTLSPIDTSATYNTYLSLSGLSDVLEVRKDGSLISPESGKYYLGDISGDTQVSIKFKAGSVGTHGFTLTLTSNDAIMSKTYTTTKQVTYQVEPLPFSVQMPSEWQVGTNELRISESSGQSYLITAVLKDSQGNEVWSDSYAFSPYEAHTFTVNVPAEGSYTLELQWNGQTAVYDITVNPAITLETKTLTVSEGGEGTIVIRFKNPSSSVQYYTIKVSGGFLPREINQSLSVAPLTEKDVSIAFAVPEDLTYDAYELNVAVYQGNATVFSDKVAVSISEDSGFTLFGGGSNISTWVYALLGLLVLGGAILILRR